MNNTARTNTATATTTDAHGNPTTKPNPAPTKKTRKPTTKPAAPAKPVSFPLCGCGCGVPTVTAKATFLSGHDARLAGVLGRARATGKPTAADQARYDALSPRLQAKVDGIVETHRNRAAKKDAAAQARKVAKAAYDKAMADALR